MNTRREDAHRAVLLITCLLISLILASQILLETSNNDATR